MKTTQKTQLNLITPFLNEELDYKNDYVSYIVVGKKSSVTSKSNNSISSQNKKYHRFVDNILVKQCSYFQRVHDRHLFVCSKDKVLDFVAPIYELFKQYYKDYEAFSIFNPQSHNGMPSLM